MPAPRKTAPAVNVKVQPQVAVGASTIGGTTITLAAYIGAVVSIIHGNLDPTTLVLAAVGTVALVTTLAGRFAQAVAAIKSAGVTGVNSVGVLALAPLAAIHHHAGELLYIVVLLAVICLVIGAAYLAIRTVNYVGAAVCAVLAVILAIFLL